MPQKILVLACAIGLCVLAGACGETPTAAPTSFHASFFYQIDTGPIVSKTWHAGDTISLVWKATPQTDQASIAAPKATVTLQVRVTGAYPSVDALKQDVGAAGSATNFQFIGNPITTDTWSNQPYTTTMALPADVQPGFYNVEETMAMVSGGQKAATIFQVVK